MSSLRARRPVLRATVLATVAVAAATCGSPPTVVPPPNPGTVSLTVSTTGSDLDQDGYTVALDDGSPQNVSPNGSVTFSDLQPGAHTLTLGDVASNCEAGPSNPLSVSVQSDATASVRFDVQCGVVVAASGGTAATPDGKARVDVPSGALSDSTIISVVPAPDSLLPSPAPGYVTGSAYQYRPDGTQFSKPVQITLVYNPASVPSGSSESSIRLHTVLNGQWVPVTGSTVDTSLHSVTGQTTHFSVYGAVASQPGVLRVISATSGARLDSTGYEVSVDGGLGQPLAINDTLDVAGLSVGDHEVRLDSVAANCTVAGSNPRTVSVPAQDTATTTFTVSCSSQTGDLQVTTSTSGTNLDPDGYAVSVDSGLAQHVAINGSLTLPGLAAGAHSVRLDSVAANCTVAGGATKSVTVPDGGTATAAFDITCSAAVGNLKVRAPTSGPDPDPDGYTVTLDGTLSQHVATGDSVTFSNVAVGTHSVELSGLFSNCSISGSNPLSVDVAFDSTSTATFDVTCAAFPGDLVVLSVTTGQNLDPDGYSVSVDGGAGTAIAINASLTVPNLAAGDHQVLLDGVANNCTVSQPNPRTVTIPDGGVDSTTFAVDCSKRVGDLVVKTSTSGTDPDNAYQVLLDGGSAQSIAGTDSILFSNVAEGSHTVTLSGVNANCTVSGGDSKTIGITYTQTTTTTFTVSCVADVGTIHATASTSGSDQDSNGYTLALDGGTPVAISSPTGSHDFTGVPVGSHTVTLGGVNTNCSISSAGGATRTVNVTFDTSVNAAFAVSCSPNQGSIQASNTTTGPSPDADGYSVSVDGGSAKTMAANGNVTFNNVAVGSHSVAIDPASVAPNCTVTSANPQSIGVTFSDTATAAFTINCVANVGSIKATTSTSGTNPDADGYTISVDGGTPQAISSNGSVVFPGLTAGTNHSVQLTASTVANNCSVTSANPQSIGVTFSDTATAAFTISCAADVGSIKASNATTGTDLDPDGYSVSVDGGTAQTMTTNGNVTFNSVAVGSRSVAISTASVAPNCNVTSANPASASVTFGDTASVSFTIACDPNVGSIKATTSSSGVNIPGTYTVDWDGTNTTSIDSTSTTGVTFSNVPAGGHTVNLTVPANCAVTGGPAKGVTVQFGQTVPADFTVTCS